MSGLGKKKEVYRQTANLFPVSLIWNLSAQASPFAEAGNEMMMTMMMHQDHFANLESFCGVGRNRTADTWIFSPL
ncbi:MAG TPA: hypothetical protein PKE06_01075, partial [Flavilitoribacter sp.]|nr:hypothetical protein [Flavilitoribacter sp.]HMQ90702.1 hypothetical protein [Flavilitoribacter sp.]